MLTITSDRSTCGMVGEKGKGAEGPRRKEPCLRLAQAGRGTDLAASCPATTV